MDSILEKLPPKWVVFALAIFIVGRAVTAIVDEEFGVKILSSGGQVSMNGFTLFYIGNTILLPLFFALLTLELTKNSLSKPIFNVVLAIHLLAVFFVSFRLVIDAIVIGPTQQYGEGIHIVNDQVFYRSVIASSAVLLTTLVAFYLRAINFRIFNESANNA